MCRGIQTKVPVGIKGREDSGDVTKLLASEVRFHPQHHLVLAITPLRDDIASCVLGFFRVSPPGSLS